MTIRRRSSQAMADVQMYADFSARNSIGHVATKIAVELATILSRRIKIYCTSGRRPACVPSRSIGMSTTAPVGVFVGFPRDSIGLLSKHKHFIGFYVCEGDRIPEHWVEICNAHTMICVPSKYCQDAFVSSGVKVPVKIVPHGIDPPSYDDNPKLGKLTLLHIFNSNPMYYRKAIDELVDAFEICRRKTPYLSLILKTNASPYTDRWRREGVRIITSWYSRPEVDKLYSRVHALSYTTTAEGFGIPVLEALAMKVPVIAPYHSGLMDFMDTDRDCVIPGPYPKYKAPTYDNDGASMFKLGIDQIVAGIDDFVDNQEEYQRKVNSFDASMWTWAAVIKPVVHIIDEVLRSEARKVGGHAFHVPRIENNPPPKRPHATPQSDLGKLPFDRTKLSLWMDAKQKAAYAKDPTGLGVVLSELAKRLPVTDKQDSVLLAPFNPDFCKFSMFRVPVVAYTTFESDRWPDRWVRELNYSLKVIVPQEWVRKALIDSGCKVPVEVIPQAYKRFEPPQRKRDKDEPYTFGFLGVPVARKNLAMAAEALPDGCKLLVRAAWLPGGVSKITKTGVEYVGGNLSDQGVYDQFWSKIDCLVFPSAGEGYSMVPREAIHMGIPVITTDIPAHKDISGPKVPIMSQVAAHYEFLGHTCGMWGKPDRAALKQMMLDTSLGKVDFTDQKIPDHNWDDTVKEVKKVCDYSIATFVPNEDRGGGIDRFALHMQRDWPELQYVAGQSELVDVAKCISTLIVQFEYGLYSVPRLTWLKGLKEKHDLKLVFVMHSVNGFHHEAMMNKMVADMADKVILLNPGQDQFISGTYLEHPWPKPGKYRPGKTGVIGTHGFIHKQKGYKYLFTIARNMGLKTLIAGKLDTRNAGNESTYTAQIKRNMKPGDVHHNRYLQDGELYEIMKQADVLVYPYEPWRNHQASGAVRSAIEFGRPIVVSEHREYFDTPDDIFPRIKLKDPEQMVKVVKEVMRAPKKVFDAQAKHARARDWVWFDNEVRSICDEN